MATAEKQELKVNGFVQGDTQTDVRCEHCDKPVPGKRGWWRKVSYEYDEWTSLCKPCAVAYVHHWDDFDAKAWDEVMSSQPSNVTE